MDDQTILSFMRYVEQTPTCWIWTGPSYPDGRLRWTYKGKYVNPRKLVYELLRGPISIAYLPPSCGNRRCVNPDHALLAQKRMVMPVTAAPANPDQVWHVTTLCWWVRLLPGDQVHQVTLSLSGQFSCDCGKHSCLHIGYAREAIEADQRSAPCGSWKRVDTTKGATWIRDMSATSATSCRPAPIVIGATPSAPHAPTIAYGWRRPHEI